MSKRTTIILTFDHGIIEGQPWIMLIDKINLIKQIRSLTNCDLRDAKETIDIIHARFKSITRASATIEA
jgi:hypothetical protein